MMLANRTGLVVCGMRRRVDAAGIMTEGRKGIDRRE
jgi:hypothetical protein